MNQGTMRGGHAVVIGGSLAGLTAAKALAGHFERVTLVERDRFPDGPAFRKGVPQARHIHVLMPGGQVALERLFPGFMADLRAAGAVALRVFEDVCWLNAQGWSARFLTDRRIVSCSRALLDWRIRQCLAAVGNLEVVEGHDITAVLPDAGGTEVAGVRLRARDAPEGSGAAATVDLEADLVVDASGRSTKAPDWLEALGYDRPVETRVDAGLGYASRVYALPAGSSADWRALYLQAQPPVSSRSGTLCSLEGGRWMVTLSGVGGDHPPTDEAGFLEFARSLRSRMLYEAIRKAEPLTPISGYRRTENERREYERMRRWPERFVVVGDAACAFNPVYGHGMSVAAQTAVALDRLLASVGPGSFARRFQREVARCNAGAWLIATGEDLRYPTTIGAKVDARTRLVHRYLDRVLRTANRNQRVSDALGNVLGLLAPPASLFRPAVMVRAVALGYSHEPSGGTEQQAT